MVSKVEPTILDIRVSKSHTSIPEQIIHGLSQEPKTLPALLFYSTEGIQHWNHHAHQPDFYPREEEIFILRRRAHDIASTIANNSVVIDLGSASLDKVLLLLSAIEAQQKTISYYALDLSDVELTAALENIPTSQFQYVRFAALHGTFDDGLRWLREAPGICDMPHHILLFGLTLGNYSRPNAAAFLKSISEHALSTSPEQSSILVTLDSCKVPTKVLRAYTCEGVVPFALTALQYGNTLLRQEKEDGSHPSHDTFHSDDWHFLSEWNYVLGRHEASLIPRSGDLRLGPPLSDITVRKEEKVRFGCSYKYDKGELETLFGSAGLENLNVWSEDGCNVAFYELKLSSG